ASSTQGTPAARRSRAPLVIAGLAGALVVGAVAFFVVGDRGGGREPAPAVTPVATAAPADASVAVALDAAAPAVAEPETPRTPEPPSSVIVTVEGVPDGTEVSIAGTVVGVAPGPVQIPRGDRATVLTFRNSGYIAVSKSII